MILLALGAFLPAAQADDLRVQATVVAPKRVDCDAMIAGIKARTSRFEQQKYIQGAIVGVGAVAAILFWRSMRQKPTDVSSAVGPTGAATVTSQQENREFSIRKYLSNAAHNTWGMVVTVFASALAYQLKDTVFSSGFTFLGKLWNGTDKCRLLHVLTQGALNSFDGLLRRRGEGIISSDSIVISRYNPIISSLERYVIELSAHTIYLSQKRDVPCDALFQLLDQFVGDVDAVSSKLEQLEDVLPFEDARSRILCSMILQTIRHIEELHTKLSIDFDQQAVEPSREHDFS